MVCTLDRGIGRTSRMHSRFTNTGNPQSAGRQATARGLHGRHARTEERNPASRAPVPYYRRVARSRPASIDRPPIVIRLGDQEFSGEDVRSIPEQRVGLTSGRLALLMPGKKTIERHSIPHPQGREPIAALLDTQPRRGLTIRADWIKAQSHQGSEPGKRAWLSSPIRSVHRDRTGESVMAGRALNPHPDRISWDDNDESVGENEADESHQRPFWRMLAGVMRWVIRCVSPGF
jgi:hypothetical protein